jgi:hypothetical protein
MRFIPTFRRNTLPQSSGLKKEAVCPSETLAYNQTSTEELHTFKTTNIFSVLRTAHPYQPIENLSELYFK